MWPDVVNSTRLIGPSVGSSFINKLIRCCSGSTWVHRHLLGKCRRNRSSAVSPPDHAHYKSHFLRACNSPFEAVNFHESQTSLKVSLGARQRQKFPRETMPNTLTGTASRWFAGNLIQGKSIPCPSLQATALEKALLN